MSFATSGLTDRIVLQLSANPVLSVAANALSDCGYPVIGVVGTRDTPPDGCHYARWLSIDRRSPAAQPVLSSLLTRADVILGEGLDAMADESGSIIRVHAQPATALVSGVRAGLAMPGVGDMVSVTPAVDVIAGQALALRILAELRLPADQRCCQPIECCAEQVTLDQLTMAGGTMPAIPPAGRFETADVPIVLSAGGDDAFGALVSMFNRQDLLADFRYKTVAARIHNGPALHALLDDILAEEPAMAWLERLGRYGIPACIAPDPEPQPADPVGCVSAEIVQELGFRLEQIAGWQQRGVIGCQPLEAGTT